MEDCSVQDGAKTCWSPPTIKKIEIENGSGSVSDGVLSLQKAS